jgi:hypothetical protein
MKNRIFFLAVHVILITGIVVFLAFQAYPEEVGGVRHRLPLLQEIHNELKLHKKDTGTYPANLDALLSFDMEKIAVFFGSKEMTNQPRMVLEEMQGSGINRFIRYALIEEVPVITHLGMDGMDGGLELNMDVSYPPEYQKPFPFRVFMQTKQFRTSFFYGFSLAGAVSVCLLAMWSKRYPPGQLPVAAIVLSVLFVIFELFLINIILAGHVYPHH